MKQGLLCETPSRLASKKIPRNLRSFGMLRSLGWYLITDVSGQYSGPIFRDQAAEDLTLEYETEILSRDLGNRLQSTPYKSPEERRLQLHHKFPALCQTQISISHLLKPSRVQGLADMVALLTFLLVSMLITFDVESEFVRSLLVREAIAALLAVHCHQTDHQQGHLKYAR